jgi:hypothetical protein
MPVAPFRQRPLRLAPLANPSSMEEMLVGAVGIGIRTPLIPRNLLILQDGRNYKNIEFAKVRYTRGTRTMQSRMVQDQSTRREGKEVV